MQIWIVIDISKDLQQSFLSETLNFQSDLANNEKLSLHKNKQIISKRQTLSIIQFQQWSIK